jgi:predicted O-methyltransferase YrrM
MDTNEIKGWFPPESAATLERLIKEHNIKSVLEVGTFVGKSALFFSKLVDKVFCVDTFEKNNELRENGVDVKEDFFGEFKDNMIKSGAWPKLHVMRMNSKEAAELFVEGTHKPAELIYLDASHDFGNVLRDIMLWTPLAGSIICGDDYDENWPGVKQAVDRYFYNAKVEGRFWFVIL